jgi:NAD(P)H dehydrogenase (quinone)
VGLPYSESELMQANAGAAPYGALHMAGAGDNPNLSSSEQCLAFALGARLAHTTVALNRAKP